MIKEIFLRCGIVKIPLMVVSVVMISFILGHMLTIAVRGRRNGTDHKRFIEPLEGVAVSLGLLGSVSGFIKAFGSFSGQMDPQQLTGGLKEAYYTTLVGLTLSLIGTISCYIFDLIEGNAVQIKER